MHLHKTSIRPAPPGISFREKSGVVTALCPITANLIIVILWLGVRGEKSSSGIVVKDDDFCKFLGRILKYHAEN